MSKDKDIKQLFEAMRQKDQETFEVPAFEDLVSS